MTRKRSETKVIKKMSFDFGFFADISKWNTAIQCSKPQGLYEIPDFIFIFV